MQECRRFSVSAPSDPSQVFHRPPTLSTKFSAVSRRASRTSLSVLSRMAGDDRAVEIFVARLTTQSSSLPTRMELRMRRLPTSFCWGYERSDIDVKEL